jgi:hypothetical protein
VKAILGSAFTEVQADLLKMLDKLVFGTKIRLAHPLRSRFARFRESVRKSLSPADAVPLTALSLVPKVATLSHSRAEKYVVDSISTSIIERMPLLPQPHWCKTY